MFNIVIQSPFTKQKIRFPFQSSRIWISISFIMHRIMAVLLQPSKFGPNVSIWRFGYPCQNVGFNCKYVLWLYITADRPDRADLRAPKRNWMQIAVNLKHLRFTLIRHLLRQLPKKLPNHRFQKKSIFNYYSRSGRTSKMN